jgi:putative heme-binding domain-containing protein
MHADHRHFDTAYEWQKSRDGAANEHGGGHAHGGMMIYQGDNWPAAYRGKLYTLNFHGRRANQEILVREGSGYAGRHGADLFVSDDPWFRGIELSSGPNGGVFVLDWSDIGECHNSTGVNRTSGRIYRITHGNPNKVAPFNLAKLLPAELVALQTHANEWFARQARLQLATRARAGQRVDDALAPLNELFNQGSPVHALRALWTLYAIGAAQPDFLRAQLRHPDEHVRAWAIRLLSDAWPLDTVLSQRPTQPDTAPDARVLAEFTRLGQTDPSALVRLALATVLQRLPPPNRVQLALALGARREDVADHNLPLMIWYGLIPLGGTDPHALARIAAGCDLPVTRKLVARRLAEEIEKTPGALNDLIVAAMDRDPAFQADIIDGIAEGLSGWRRAPQPDAWDSLASKVNRSGNAVLQERVRDLKVVFGDGRAIEDVKALVLNPNADLAARQAALRSLIEARPPELRQICEQLLRVRFMNVVAVRGLALFDDPAIGDRIAGAYQSFHPSQRAAVLETLVSRPEFARALLAQIPAGRVPRSDITPFHARQIRSFDDPALTRQLTETWGELREPVADKQALIAKLKTELTPATLATANKSQGRALFNALCAACHTLHGEGGALGPDLTGAGRDNLDYLLENIADPSAVVTADFRMSVVKLEDGRTLTGFIAARTARTLTLQGMTETHTVEHSEVSRIDESSQSVMPDGLLEALTSVQRRDLIAYLMHPSQVALP